MSAGILGQIYARKTRSSTKISKQESDDPKEKITAENILNLDRLMDRHKKGVEKIRKEKSIFFQNPIPKAIVKSDDGGLTVETDKDCENFKISHFYSKKPTKVQRSVSKLVQANQSSEEVIIIPFGRMLKCELVNSMDSINMKTPMVGLVMEDLWIDEYRVIPAGSEVHGTATTDKVRDRICSDYNWVIVFPKTCKYWASKSIAVKSVALDREDRTGEGRTFGITDGSYGIKGYRIQSTEMDELKIFAAAFLEAALMGVEKTEPIGLSGGTQVIPNASNAALGGSAAVMNEYIQMIKAEIVEKGFYTRVPAGKQFYLYMNEEIALAQDNGMFRLIESRDQRLIGVKQSSDDIYSDPKNSEGEGGVDENA